MIIKEAFSGLWTSFLQWGINRISDQVFKFKKAEAIGLMQQHRRKYYVIQSGYFSWTVLCAKDIELYKRMGQVAKNVTAKELESLAAYVADPMRVTNLNTK
jgi:hypothetical protein